ncbi:MAG: LysE family translocator [Asticcacaulis sp.]
MSALPVAFRLLAIGGGIYVGWLGFSTFHAALRLENETLDAHFTTPAEARSLWATLRDGFMVQMLNPKVLLFFSAVLPPFLDVRLPAATQMPVFAATAIGMDVISMTSYGLAAVHLAGLLRDPHNKQRFDLGAGAVLMLISAMILVHAGGDLLMPH